MQKGDSGEGAALDVVVGYFFVALNSAETCPA